MRFDLPFLETFRGTSRDIRAVLSRPLFHQLISLSSRNWLLLMWIESSDTARRLSRPSGAMRRRVAHRCAIGDSQEESVVAIVDTSLADQGWTAQSKAITRVIVIVSAYVGAPRDADVGVVGCRRRSLATIVGQIGRRPFARWFACEVDSRSPAYWMEDDDDEGGDDDDATRDAWYRGVSTTLERRQRRPRRARRFPIHPASYMVSRLILW